MANYEDKEIRNEFNKAYLEIEHLYNWLKKTKENEKIRDTLSELINFELKKIVTTYGFYDISFNTYKDKSISENKDVEIEDLIEDSYEIEKTETFINLLLEWWGKEGFGYISEIIFPTPTECNARLCINFHWMRVFTSDVAKHEKLYNYDLLIEKYEKLGFQFHVTKTDTHKLLDTEINRELIRQFLAKEFPTISINQWGTEYLDKKRSKSHIKYIDVSISDIHQS